MKSLKEWDIARILITAFVVLTVTFIVIILTLLNKTTIYNGVSINGIEVGGLNRLDAVKLLENSMKDDLENREVTFNYEDYTYLVKLHELGITYDYYKAADAAYGVGREGNALEKLKDIYKAKFYGRTIEIELLYNKNKINSMIDKIEISLNKESKNAEIQYKKNKFTSCEYCDYSAICQFDGSIKDNKYRNMNDKKDDEVLELMRKAVEC